MIAGSLLVAAGLMISDLAPFDVSIDIGDLKTAIKAARPIPFGPAVDGSEFPAEPWSWARETLTWIMVGGLFMLAFREAGWTGFRAMGGTAVAGGLSLAIEVLQLTIRSPGLGCNLGGLVAVRLDVGGNDSRPFWCSRIQRRLGPAMALWFMIGTSRLAPHRTLRGPNHRFSAQSDWCRSWHIIVALTFTHWLT